MYKLIFGINHLKLTIKKDETTLDLLTLFPTRVGESPPQLYLVMGKAPTTVPRERQSPHCT
jgi:hypothetical protein